VSSARPRRVGTVVDGDHLQAILSEYGVETSGWGEGEAKALGHLLTELRAGDCELVVDERGLARLVRNVWVDVFAHVGAARHHLVERRQVFIDGRTRRRSLPASIGEKCTVGEDPAVAAVRGIGEELGIVSPLALTPGEPRENPVGPPSYPTLRTLYDTAWYVVELDASDYRPEGYVEVQSDKSTYFEWES